jgi:hypothetical protein
MTALFWQAMAPIGAGKVNTADIFNETLGYPWMRNGVSVHE